MMETPIKQRVMMVFEMKHINIFTASKILNIPQRTLNRQINEEGTVSLAVVVALLERYPDVSAEWLLLGRGKPLKDDEEPLAAEKAPYYKELPVTAGRSDVVAIEQDTFAEYCVIPGVKAEFFFRVVGHSMEPEFMPGDLIGVTRMHDMQQLSEDDVYMIVTRDERMVKRIKECKSDPTLLLCVSCNNPSFVISKSDVLALYKVVFRGQIL